MDIPELQTERLSLRAMTYDDWPAYADFMASQRSEFMGGPFTTSVAWGMFCADQAQWDFFGLGALSIEDRKTGATLGQVGLNSGPLFPELELGWLVWPEAEGRGVAFEAAATMRDWAKTIKQVKTLVSYIDPENERSRKLAERLGATLDPDAPKQDPTDLVYRHF